ncbi:MAG: hypothetical protein K8R41_09120 [Bacteroidales bacterium]|nr:hypothetical protein [Bacteroidales bacterium]
MKSLINKLFNNNNFLSLSNNIVVAIFGFFSFFILVRTLEPDIFGEWVLYITAGNFIEMLRFGIMRTAIIRFLSGAKGEEKKKLIGSNWVIGLIATLIIVVIIWFIYFIFRNSIESSGYLLFFIWYPILALLNLPFNSALSILHAEQKFDKLLIIRLINVGVFVVFLTINIIFIHWGIMEIVFAHLFFNFLTSLICMIYKWDGIQYFFKATRKTNKLIINFGKYSTGSFIGSNLLKSTDAFLIGISAFMGTTGVALYSVPLKLTEILEIPLRSYVATAFPKMSKASIENNIKEVKHIYYSYTGGLTYLLLPIVIIGFIFAEEFVYIIGGKNYIETANIFRVFCIYGLFIPIDKFTGVALDSINKPRKNFYKVVYMASANIIGDYLVIFLISKFLLTFSIITLLPEYFSTGMVYSISSHYALLTSLELVAVVTICFTIIGIIVGTNYLNKEIKINFKYIFIEGINFYKDALKSGKKAFIK